MVTYFEDFHHEAVFFFNSQVEDKINQVDSFIDRFRANLVVNGQEPFREDEWKMIKIGDLSFKVSCHFIFSLLCFMLEISLFQ